MYYLISAIIFLLAGSLIGYFLRKIIGESKISSAEKEAERIIEEAKKEAEAKKREALVEAREAIQQMRSEAERENREHRNELQRLEKRLMQKEENLERKTEQLELRETNLQKQQAEIEEKKQEIEKLYQKEIVELERISNLTKTEAKEILFAQVEEETKRETAMLIKEMENKAKEEAERKAQEIIATAIQRSAADYVAENTVSVVNLPNDEMKGRIIGREGRNIRALENYTGVDLIIDDTPEAVIISSFDPIRREVARIALEKLVADGRIHPARIEEMIDKAKKELEQKIREEGEQAAFACGIHGLHPDLIKLLGRLRYRTSYGQNVLKHSLEVAHLAANMASELGVNVEIAKRAGLLHDIGKAVDYEVEGPHVEIGIELLKKYRESQEVIHAVQAHHGDIEPQTVEAVLVQAADAISAARPGARRETLEAYLKRLQKLEEIASSFKGVEKSYAIQAGREIRIMVKPEEISDEEATLLAHEIVKRIENEMDYPGQIKVIVIRETRAVNYAK